MWKRQRSTSRAGILAAGTSTLVGTVAWRPNWRHYEASSSYLCGQCVGDPYLAEQVNEHGTSARCSYCEDAAICVPLESVCERLDEVLRENYKFGHDEPDYESVYDNPRYVKVGETLQAKVCEAIGADGQVIDDLCQLLISGDNPDVGSGEDVFYAHDQLYEFSEVGDFEHHQTRKTLLRQRSSLHTR